MKKPYETPSVEKIAFNYRDQVVAASGIAGQSEDGSSTDWQGYLEKLFESGFSRDVIEEILRDIFGF